MTGPTPSGPFDDQGDPARARRFARMWTQLAIGVWVIAVVATLLWWSAQANDLTSGPHTSFRAGATFPWYVVVPGVALGTYALVRAGRSRARARTLRRDQGSS